MLLIGVALCSFQTVSCNNPILTKPSCYLGHIKHIVLTKDYETLDSWPRTDTYIGSKGLTPEASNPIIEIFEIENGRTVHRFILYRTLDAASHEYECERARYAPVCYEESNQTGVKAFQSDIIRPRADVEGAYTPMDHYTAHACVQLRNAVVDVVVNSANPSVPEMEDALKRLSEIVGKE